MTDFDSALAAKRDAEAKAEAAQRALWAQNELRNRQSVERFLTFMVQAGKQPPRRIPIVDVSTREVPAGRRGRQTEIVYDRHPKGHLIGWLVPYRNNPRYPALEFISDDGRLFVGSFEPLDYGEVKWATVQDIPSTVLDSDPQ